MERASVKLRAEMVERRFTQLASGFRRYLETFDQRGPFSSDQLQHHLRTIERRRQLGSGRTAAHDPRFAELLYDTLRSWRLGTRSSSLRPLPLFAEALERHADQIGELDALAIDDPNLPAALVLERIGLLVASLHVVDNRAKVVAGTKTLHHLLPDLVPPMDRAWTGRFLGRHAPEWQSQVNQAHILATAFSGLSRVARYVSPQQFVGSGWRSSRTKVLDNALIGYCILEIPEKNIARRPAGQSPGHALWPVAGSYVPITEWLTGQRGAAVTLTFAELERLLGRKLPPSARVHREWWANHAGNTQGRAWLGAGWRVEAVDLPAAVVRFGRTRT